MSRRSAAVLPVVVAVLAACGAPPGTGSSPTPYSPTPQAEAIVYFVGDTPRGFRLYPERHLVPELTGDLALDALRSLVDGNERPHDPDYASPWAGSGSSVLSLERADGTATLDLAYGHLNVGAEAEMRAIDQLLWTAAAADPSIRRLRITVDGSAVESLAGHVDATRPFPLEPTYEVLAGVSIDVPQQGQMLEGPIVVSGEACTFEANVAWELYRNGTLVDQGSTAAAAACPDRSPWSIDLGVLEAGDYEVRAFELSAEDGSLVVADSRRFAVGSSG